MHEPVLVEEVLGFLNPKPSGIYIDATVGMGGHAAAILARGARVVGVDQDPQAIALAWERLAPWADRVQLVRGNFRDLPMLVASLAVSSVDGILLDLGASSLQFDAAARGFAFRTDGPLDMRMDPDAATTAADLINILSERELEGILWQYGEERYARRIARAIARARPIHTTGELAHLVAGLYPRGHHRIHPATRTFQAIRIAVNDELSALAAALPAALRILAPGGTLCVISFQSLEDRIVKHFLRQAASAVQIEILTKKPVVPTPEETARNPRARSAKLRAGRVSDVVRSQPICP